MRGVTLPPQLLHGYNYNVVVNQQHQQPQHPYQPQHQQQYQQHQCQPQHPTATLSRLPGSREQQHPQSLGGGQQQHQPGPRPNYQNVPAIVVDQPQPPHHSGASISCGDSATFQRLGMRPGSHSESVVSEEAQQALETRRIALTQVGASCISVVAEDPSGAVCTQWNNIQTNTSSVCPL